MIAAIKMGFGIIIGILLASVFIRLLCIVCITVIYKIEIITNKINKIFKRKL